MGINSQFTPNFWKNIHQDQVNKSLITSELEKIKNYAESLHEPDSLTPKKIPQIIENLGKIISDIEQYKNETKKRIKQKDIRLLLDDVQIREMIKIELATIQGIINLIGTKNMYKTTENSLNKIKKGFRKLKSDNQSKITEERQIMSKRLNINDLQIKSLFTMKQKSLSREEQDLLLNQAFQEKKYEYAASLLKLGIVEEVPHNLVFLAISSNDISMLEILVEAGADLHCKEEKTGYIPLVWAIKKENLELVKFLIDHGANVNLTIEIPALIKAIEQGNFELIKLLVDHGADINSVDVLGRTALLRVVEMNSINLELVQFLIDHGANVNLNDNYNESPLLRVIQREFVDLELVKLLVDHGANVNCRNNQNTTPLSVAVHKNHKEIVEYLLSCKNIDISPQDWLKMRLNYYSFKNHHIIKIIEDKLSRDDQLRLKNIEELFHRLEIGHVFHLSGKTQFVKDKDIENISLEGIVTTYSNVQWYPIIYKSLEHFSDYYPELLNRELAALLQESLAIHFDPDFTPEKVVHRIKQGLPTLINTGFSRHTVTLLFWKDHFIICNRGGESRTPLDAFHFNPENLTESIIETLVNVLPNKDREIYKKFMFEDLSKQLNLNKFEFENMLDETPLSHQTVGNCSWVSSITGICALLLLEGLRGQKEEFNQLDENREQTLHKTGQLNEEIPEINHDLKEKVEQRVALFQKWVGFQKIEALDRLIKPMEENVGDVQFDYPLMIRTLHEAIFLDLDPISKEKLEKIKSRFFASLSLPEKCRVYTDLQFWKFLVSDYSNYISSFMS